MDQKILRIWTLFTQYLLRFYYAKPLGTLEEDRQVLEFGNPVLDLNDEDNDIFEPERRFLVFLTLL